MLQWSSDNTSIATVDESGRVTAKSAGTAIITATANDGSNKSDVCEVIVVLPVTSITINPAKVKIIAGDTYHLTAIIEPENAYNSNITWSSDNPAIATVDQNGNVKSKSAGKTIVKATSKDGCEVVGECEITVTVPVSHVSIDKNSVTIKKGDSLTLNATVLPTGANDKSLTWFSSNTNVATVDQNGKVTAVHGGKATITATARDGSGKYDICEVQVIVMVDSIVLNKSSISMSKGEQTKLIATVKPDDATNKSVTWSSSDWAYARVDQNGNVVAKSSGVVYISATATDGSNVSANCEIIINYPRTGWVANIDYTASVNVRKSPNTTETVTTARYGRVLTVTAPAVDGWYPVILSDGTHGYISSQFVVWEKPYDPPAKTTVTKNYIYISKSGYPKSGWAGNQLKQTQKLKLKSSPKPSSNTVRSVPYATEGVVRGKTSNGYYVSGGNGYQVVYGVTSHITFKKPTANTALLSSDDALVVKASNEKSSTGCCGSSGENSSDDIPDEIPNGTTTKTEDPVDVENANDNTQFIERHMSNEGKIVLRKLELSKGYGDKCGLFGNGVYPDNIEIYPYWVGDNGITIGFGHYISANDVNVEAELISKLGLQNAKFNVTYKDLDPNYVKGNKKPLAKRVTDSKPVDVATVNTLFNDDVAEMEAIVNDFCSGNNDGNVKIALTQQEFDALIIYRFKAGELGQTIADLLKGKNREPGNWKDAFHSGDRGEKELAIFFNDPGCYD